MRSAIMCIGALLFLLALAITFVLAIAYGFAGEYPAVLFKFFCAETVGFAVCGFGVESGLKGDDKE